MKITTIFYAVFVSINTLLGLMIFIMFLVFSSQEEMLNTADKRYDSYLLADELRQSSDDLTRFARTFSVTGDPQYEQNYLSVLQIRNGEIPRPNGEKISLQELMRHQGFSDAEFAKLRESEDKSNNLVLLETIAMNAAKGLFADKDGRFSIQGDPDLELATKLTHSATYHIEKATIMKPIEEFFSLMTQRTSEEMHASMEQSKNYLKLMLAFFVFTILISIAGMLILNRKIKTIPILQASLLDFFAYINHEHDQITPIKLDTRDEFGVMARAINDGIQTIQKGLAQDKTLINETSEIVKKAHEGYLGHLIQSSPHNPQLAELKKLLNEMLANFKQSIDAITSVLSQYAQNNFVPRVPEIKKVGDSYALINGVNHMGDEIVHSLKLSLDSGHLMEQKSQSLKELMATLSQSVNEQAASLEQSAAAVEEINSSMQGMNDRASAVSKQTDEIRAIINMIRDIADQTNLLALNAAIEAARAGEHGRGFAVVADEVRSLAERTQKSLGEIERNTTVLVEAVNEMAQAIQEQAQGIGQINDTIAQLDTVTQQNATVANQTDGIAQEVFTMAESIVQTIRKKHF